MRKKARMVRVDPRVLRRCGRGEEGRHTSTSVKPDQFGGLEHNMLEVIATETKHCEVHACLFRHNGNVTVCSCFSELPRYGEEYREILRPSDLAVTKKCLRRTVRSCDTRHSFFKHIRPWYCFGRAGAPWQSWVSDIPPLTGP